jgi:hypothetical protein
VIGVTAVKRTKRRWAYDAARDGARGEVRSSGTAGQSHEISE